MTLTTALVLGLALLAGLLLGLQTFFDIVLGSAVVLLPSLWVAVSVTSGHSAVSPALMGLARYTLAGLGFAALFALRPSSSRFPYWPEVWRIGVALVVVVATEAGEPAAPR